MACNSADTGNGASIFFAKDMGFGASAAYAITAITITQGAHTVASVDVSNLGTSGAMKSIPSDLKDVAEATISYLWLTGTNATVAMNPTTMPDDCNLITITYPMRTGETQAATFSGYGFISSFTPPSFSNGQLQVGQMTVKFDGNFSGPNYQGSL